MVISKPALRAYIQTFVFALTSLLLLVVAIVSYLIFYSNFIPRIGVHKPLYFKYGGYNSEVAVAADPMAAVQFLPAELFPDQAYDITIRLRLPTSPENINRGNFMCQITIHNVAFPPSPSGIKNNSNTVLLRVQRPGIMTYSSPLLATLKTLMFSPLLVTGMMRQEESVRIILAENAMMGGNPRSALVEILSSPPLAVYDASLEFSARLAGLRWLVYTYRLLSFMIFVAVFWVTEMIWALFVWFRISALLQRALSPPRNIAGNRKGQDGEAAQVQSPEALEGDGGDEDDSDGAEYISSMRPQPQSWQRRRRQSRSPYPTPESTPAPEGGPYEDDEECGPNDNDNENSVVGIAGIHTQPDTGGSSTSRHRHRQSDAARRRNIYTH